MSAAPARALRIVALTAAMLALIAGVGFAWVARGVPADHHVRTAVVLRQGPAAVWQVATGWSGQADWRSDVAAVAAGPAGDQGWRLDHPDGGHTDVTVLSWNPPRSVTLQLDGPELVGTWTMDLVRAGLGTGVVLTERGTIPGTLQRVIAHQTGALGQPAQRFLVDLTGALGEEAEVITAAEDVAALTAASGP